MITPIIIGKYTSTRKSDLHVMSDRKLTDRLEKILSLQMNKVIIFGTPKVHNSLGSEAWNNKGIVQNTIKNIKSNFDKKLQVIADVCVCQYNLSGHCGIINYQNNQVDNDKTLKFMSKISLSYAESGADTVAPSSMMDGLVLSIRNNLNNNGYRDTKIMSFSKQHSCLYSPFRLTAFKKFSKIDKSTYQIGYSNSREMMRKIELDFLEGADIITIKPSMSNLDLISRIVDRVNCRIAVQHVSGEFAMLKAATRYKLIEEHEWLIGYFSSMMRAGANQIISYGAEEIAALI
ncbi:MAG: porphobilinogen synthase [Thermoproteota archaeon]|nr:porphobilinogen synthase [Thermoproteota archaeon]